MTIRNRSKGYSSWLAREYTYTSVQPFNYGSQPDNVSWSLNWYAKDVDYETMTDAIGSYGGINPCNHQKWLIKSVNTRPQTITYNDSRPGQTGSRTVVFQDGAGHLLDLYTAHLPVNDGTALAIARVPTMSAEQSNILVSLYELKDLKRAFTSVIERITWACRRDALRRSNPRLLSYEINRKFTNDLLKLPDTPMGWAQFLVGHNLAWQFGWAPLIKDVQTVHSVLGSLNDRFEKLSQQEFSCVGRHTETVSEISYSVANAIEPTFPWVSITRNIRRTTTVTWTAGIKRKLSPYALANPNMTKLAMARESLGLSLTGSSVWEVVPYSFVVDWVLPIQQFLEQFDGSAISSDYVIDGDKWQTVKSATNTQLTSTYAPINNTAFPVDVSRTYLFPETFTGTRTSYVRTTGPWTAPGLYIPQLRLPNLGQAWTGLQLLLQRIK